MTTQEATRAIPPPAVAARRVVPLVATLAALYVVSQFLRNSVGVIAPDLSRDLTLNAAQIGLLSSLYFLVFALAQVPLGVAIDRFGPRAAMLASVSFAVAGAVLFGLAHGVGELMLARVLMGFGCAALLMGPLAIYRRWFSHERFSTLLGMQIGMGSIGTLLATAPLARVAEAVGWRPVFLGVAVATAAMVLLLVLLVRDDPPGRTTPASAETLRESFAGVVQAMRLPDVGRLFLLHCCAYSTFATMLGLWGGPYLAHVHGLDLSARGDILLLLAAAQISALFLWGPTDRLFGSYRVPTLIGAVTTGLMLIALVVLGPLPQPWLAIWFVVFGLFAAFTPVMMAHGVALFPPHLVGRGMTLMNLGNMGGVFVWQTLTGAIMALFPAKDGAYPLAGYQTVFALQAVVLLTAAAVYARARDPRRAGANPPPA